MRIRLINEIDSKEIYNWRNNDLTREMSVNSELISFDDHKKWIINYINNPDKTIFIGEESGLKLGVVRFELNLENNTAEVSINMNPLMRSKGYGKKLLSKSIEKYLNKTKTILKAKIKNENQISINLFKSQGFIFLEKDNFYSYFEYKYNLIFKEVDLSCSDILYRLLNQRQNSISHKIMPSLSDHKKFVKKHPYLYWYIFSVGDIAIGTFYIKKDNSIGININNPSILIVKKILKFIFENFKPEKEIPSHTPNYFYINLADTNDKMKKILFKLGFLPIQVSYKIEQLNW